MDAPFEQCSRTYKWKNRPLNLRVGRVTFLLRQRKPGLRVLEARLLYEPISKFDFADSSRVASFREFGLAFKS
jgi:hypothetical protein